jgi:hypothetical protein
MKIPVDFSEEQFAEATVAPLASSYAKERYFLTGAREGPQNMKCSN